MLASAAANDSGIPQAILDAKAEEVRKRKEVQDAITVSLNRRFSLAFADFLTKDNRTKNQGFPTSARRLW